MSNDFLTFAVGGSANVTPQAAYAADTPLLQNGFVAGIANSADLNKVWRQSSIMAAVVAQFIVNQSGQNAVDDGTTATLIANLLTAIRSATKTGVILTDTGAANAYTAVNAPPLVSGTWIDGVVQQVKIAHANTGASTYAPDGLTAIPIYGLGLQPLQGGELALNGTAVLMHATIAGVNSGNPIAVLMECAGGAQQIAPATASQHAVNLGQFVTTLSASGLVKIPNTTGLPLIIQWGPLNNTGGVTSSGTFPLAFPNACFEMVLTGLNATGNTQAYATLNSSNKTGFGWTAFLATSGNAPVLAATSGSVQGSYIAIGN